MLDIIDNAKNAIDAYEAGLRINASNIANVGTTAFKGSQFSFQHIFERVLSNGQAASPFEGIGGINPTIVGGGATLANVAINFAQGALGDGGPLDIAVSSGTGMFVVSGDGGQSFLYSRAGNFQFTAQRRMVTQTGLQVFGLPGVVNADGSFTQTGSLTPISFGTATDVATLAWNDAGVLHNFTRDGQGNITVNTNADAGMQTFQIALSSVPNPPGLRQTSGTDFTTTIASGNASTPSIPGAGIVAGRRVEQSNVTFITETIRSLELQRALNGNLSIIRMVSDIISQFISKIS